MVILHCVSLLNRVRYSHRKGAKLKGKAKGAKLTARKAHAHAGKRWQAIEGRSTRHKRRHGAGLATQGKQCGTFTKQ